MKSISRFDRMNGGGGNPVMDRLLCNDDTGLNIDLSANPVGTALDSGTVDFGQLSPDSVYAPGYTPVVPDVTGLNLPGQLPGIPGGGASNGTVTASDPSGINMIHTAPAVNPTPTGGYLQSLAQVAAAASQSFTTYMKGSPAVAVPAAKTPLQTLGGALSLTTPTGQTNWLVIGGALLLVGVGIFVVVKYA